MGLQKGCSPPQERDETLIGDEDLANDPDVSLVVSSVSVDSYGSSIILFIRAGKDIYVEWLLEVNLAKAIEIFDLLRSTKCALSLGCSSDSPPLFRSSSKSCSLGGLEG